MSERVHVQGGHRTTWGGGPRILPTSLFNKISHWPGTSPGRLG